MKKIKGKQPTANCRGELRRFIRTSFSSTSDLPRETSRVWCPAFALLFFLVAFTLATGLSGDIWPPHALRESGRAALRVECSAAVWFDCLSLARVTNRRTGAINQARLDDGWSASQSAAGSPRVAPFRGRLVIKTRRRRTGGKAHPHCAHFPKALSLSLSLCSVIIVHAEFGRFSLVTFCSPLAGKREYG